MRRAAVALLITLATSIARAQPTPPPPAPTGAPGYPQPGYAQPSYPQPGYAQPGYPQPGYAQPGYGAAWQSALPGSPAQAGPAAPGYTAPGAAPAPTGEAPVDPDHAYDPHGDRMVLMPTALTQPAGSWSFTSLEILLGQVTYGFDGRTQLTTTFLPPVIEGGAFAFDVTLKHALVDHGPLRLAAMGSVSGIAGLEGGEGGAFGRAGFAATTCLDVTCRSNFSFSHNVALLGPATLVLSGAGVVWNVADWASLIVELDTVIPLARQAGSIHTVLLTPGFRFPYRTWALDLGIARPLDNGPKPEVLPVLAFTYRTSP